MTPGRRTPLPLSAAAARAPGDSPPGTRAVLAAEYQPGPFWAQLTGRSGGAYAWTQVNDGDVSGGFGQTLDGGFAATGTTTNAPAYEINGRTDVPADGSVRVRLYPAGDLTFYVFEYAPPGSGGSPPPPPTGTPNATAGYDGSGAPTSFPQYQLPTTSGSGYVYTGYQVPHLGADPTTSPIIQYQLDTSTGTPTIRQFQYTNGTGGGNGVSGTLTPTQFQTSYNLGGTTGSETLTASGGSLLWTAVGVTLAGYTISGYLTTTAAASTYVAQSRLGAASGVATLDSGGTLSSSQIPATLATQSYVSSALASYLTSAAAASTYVPASQLGADSGVATLNSSGYLSGSQIPATLATQAYVSSALGPYLTSAAAALAYVAQSQLGAASGVATLDGTTRIPSAQLPLPANFPTLNQSTTGSAATLTTGRTIALTGDVTYTSGALDGSANVTGTATVVALQGNAVGNAAPADGNVLTWVAADARWEPKAGPPVPPGTVAMYAGSAAPSGWLLCDGSSYSTTSYAALYAAIGTAYGSGTGTFKVPNMQCRFPLGAGSSTGLTTRALGATGGEEAHTLTTSELPAHTHTQTQVWYTSGSFSTVAVGGPYPLDAAPRDTQAAGGGAAHNTMPPFLVLTFIIKT